MREPTPANLRAAAVLEQTRARNASIPEADGPVPRQQWRAARRRLLKQIGRRRR